MPELPAPPLTYQIVVRGLLDDDWSLWFAGLTLTREQDASGAAITTLAGPVADQAALYGILARLADLNVTLLSVSCTGAAAAATETQEVTTQ